MRWTDRVWGGRLGECEVEGGRECVVDDVASRVKVGFVGFETNSLLGGQFLRRL